jgi:hypothetical protein
MSLILQEYCHNAGGQCAELHALGQATHIVLKLLELLDKLWAENVDAGAELLPNLDECGAQPDQTLSKPLGQHALLGRHILFAHASRHFAVCALLAKPVVLEGKSKRKRIDLDGSAGGREAFCCIAGRAPYLLIVAWLHSNTISNTISPSTKALQFTEPCTSLKGPYKQSTIENIHLLGA